MDSEESRRAWKEYTEEVPATVARRRGCANRAENRTSVYSTQVRKCEEEDEELGVKSHVKRR